MDQRIAVITGSHKGLGLEIARQLAQRDGVRVVISSRKEAEGHEAQQKLMQAGLAVDYLPLDVTNEQSVIDFTNALRQTYGRVDILVNNAGINPTMQSEENSLLTMKPEVALSTFATNTIGVLRICQALIPLMQERNYGRIVNVSTEMASLNQLPQDGYPIAPSYRLSKLGLNGLTCLLAKELAGTNVLVNAYSPGWMKTDMGGENAPFTTAEGAETAIYLATLPDGGAQGGFFAEMRKFGGAIVLPW